MMIKKITDISILSRGMLNFCNARIPTPLHISAQSFSFLQNSLFYKKILVKKYDDMDQ